MSNTLTQFGLAQAFLLGEYDGIWDFAMAKQYGNFGHGTFNGVSGELIVLDGVFYRIDENGQAHLVSDTLQTPLCTLVNFAPTQQQTVTAIADYENGCATLLTHLTKKNSLHAIKIEANFTNLIVRSETPQPKPYQPMDKSFLPTQRKFPYHNKVGTMVGFYTPSYLRNMILPGFHFHFISEDRRFGGHVLELAFDTAQISWQEINELRFFMPEDASFQSMNLNADSTLSLHAAEKT